MNYVDSNLPINAYCQRKYFKLYLKLQLSLTNSLIMPLREIKCPG